MLLDGSFMTFYYGSKVAVSLSGTASDTTQRITTSL